MFKELKRKTVTFFMAAMMLTYGTSSLFLTSSVVKAANGDIKTVTGSCGTPVNANHYPSGSTIYVMGSNFVANHSYGWQISDPGNSGNVYLIGNIVSDGNGSFCFAAGVLPDGGPYQTKIGNDKGDNFSIDLGSLTDVCPNLDGLQSEIPLGYHLSGGQCVQDPIDVCPNIPEVQTQVPDGYSVNNDGLCVQNQTQILGCTDPIAINYNSDATQNDNSCQYQGTEPSPTPEGQTLGDTTTNDVCANIDGIQTSIPDGLHLDASGRNCVSFSQSGGDNGGGSGGGQVLGASTTAGDPSPKGQVLGASTLGATGGFDGQYFAYFTIILGGLLAVASFYQFRTELFGNA